MPILKLFVAVNVEECVFSGERSVTLELVKQYCSSPMLYQEKLLLDSDNYDSDKCFE